MKKISQMESPNEGANAKTWLIGALKERGQDLICQPWPNGFGRLGILAYQWDGSAMGMKTVNPNADDTGNDASAVAWLITDVNGDRADEICQVIDFDGTGHDVRIIVYGLQGGQIVTIGHHSQTGHGTPATAWLSGNICHPKGFKRSICQVWNYASSVGMTIWDWTEDSEGGEMEAIWNSFNVSSVERADASLAWLIGDVNGDGQDEVIQVYEFESHVAMIVYGWIGDAQNGHMEVISSKHGVIGNSDSTSAVSWQIGDIDGDKKAEVIQMFENQDGTALRAAVFGWKAEEGQMDFITHNLDLTEGPRALSWHIGDFNGDEKMEICQLWKNDIGMLGMAVYGWVGGNIEEIWRGDMAVFADALSWLAGDINGDSHAEICQQVQDGDGNLKIIVYGSAAT
ncbi:hypothetical protein BAU07_24280 [Bordetella flabilis]|uniref:VCBS repeat-containing protein n=2 Tax=Bordetella flabilis TaxID=463014 RepID=A0A193GJQ0_9BORD|nr:hypothetical protein BAU07_24280 [Bordetella flabilis]